MKYKYKNKIVATLLFFTTVTSTGVTAFAAPVDTEITDTAITNPAIAGTTPADTTITDTAITNRTIAGTTITDTGLTDAAPGLSLEQVIQNIQECDSKIENKWTC